MLRDCSWDRSQSCLEQPGSRRGREKKDGREKEEDARARLHCGHSSSQSWREVNRKLGTMMGKKSWAGELCVLCHHSVAVEVPCFQHPEPVCGEMSR